MIKVKPKFLMFFFAAALAVSMLGISTITASAATTGMMGKPTDVYLASPINKNPITYRGTTQVNCYNNKSVTSTGWTKPVTRKVGPGALYLNTKVINENNRATVSYRTKSNTKDVLAGLTISASTLKYNGSYGQRLYASTEHKGRHPDTLKMWPFGSSSPLVYGFY